MKIGNHASTPVLAVQAITGQVRGVKIEVRYEPLTGTVLTVFPRYELLW